MPIKSRLPKVSKDPNKNWNNNSIQFARMLAEIHAIGLPQDMAVELSFEMDLTIEEINQIFNRATEIWDEIKFNTPNKK